MAYETIIVDIEDGVATVKLNRPDAMNALNTDLLGELADALTAAQANEKVRCIILTGSEKFFAAGADIKMMAEKSFVDVFAGDLFTEETGAILRVRKPIIAAVAGYALGGGCELAMACHMRIATETARFGQPEVNLGIIPGYGGTQRLTQLIGKAKSLELILTGNMIEAEEALRLGLANYLLQDQAAAQEKAEELLRTIAKKGPLAIEESIKAVNAYFDHAQDGYQAEAEAFGRSASSEDFVEGATAFVEKRPANFQGK